VELVIFAEETLTIAGIALLGIAVLWVLLNGRR